MIEAAETIQRFITGRQRCDLDIDEMLLFALIRAVEIIGEAASKLSQETRSATPSVPWWAIVAMRNRLIHAYFDIDRPVVPQNGFHVCFSAESGAAVAAFHAAGLAAGGRDNGAPGYRPEYAPDYYGAFIIDPDGNRLGVVARVAPGA